MEHQLQQIKLTVEKKVQEYCDEKITADSSVKLDDVGDALLHGLDKHLCGSTNFKQLVLASPSVHVNRTVAVSVFPDTTYWIVIKCQWNTFVFKNFGCFSSSLRYNRWWWWLKFLLVHIHRYYLITKAVLSCFALVSTLNKQRLNCCLPLKYARGSPMTALSQISTSTLI